MDQQIAEIRVAGSIEGLDDTYEYIVSHENAGLAPHLISGSTSDSLDEAYAPDKSLTNGSSIAFIAHLDNKKLAFLGTHGPETISEQLPPNQTIFDAIKLSHHGSSRNTSPELLFLIDSPHYFISTNGDKHNHPDFPVLKAIVDRPSNFQRKDTF